MRRKGFHCKSEAQKKAIRRSYAIRKQKAEQRRIEAPYPHFRYYRKSGHPALIVGEQVNEKKQEEYRYRKVMHGASDGGRTNETVKPNPDPTDTEPMRIGKRTRYDIKDNFALRPLPWKYPKKE